MCVASAHHLPHHPPHKHYSTYHLPHNLTHTTNTSHVSPPAHRYPPLMHTNTSPHHHLNVTHLSCTLTHPYTITSHIPPPPHHHLTGEYHCSPHQCHLFCILWHHSKQPESLCLHGGGRLRQCDLRLAKVSEPSRSVPGDQVGM